MTTKTIEKYLTNEGCVEEYVRGNADEGYAQGEHNSNVFFIGDTIYSYGTHFPMAIRLSGGMYLVNADTYSPTTSKHQCYVRRNIPKTRQILIPFSSLRNAGIPYKEVEVLDAEGDREVFTGMYVDRETGETKERYQHLMGATLFTYNNRYFLSGIDETAKDLWKGFFLTELVSPVLYVCEAYDALKPLAVQFAENKQMDVKRQGEFFFIKVEEETVLQKLKAAEKSGEVMSKVHLAHEKGDKNRSAGFEFSQSRHVVTKYVIIDGTAYAKGTCRHKAGDHKMLKLDGWHGVFENVQVQSWSSDGRVD